MEKTEQIVLVRGRPVRAVRGYFGVCLHAVERGYFPVSSTGYRSLSGFGREDTGPVVVEAETLESLARDEDKRRREIMRDAARALRPEQRPLSAFLTASNAAERAVDAGFFADDPERAILWSAADRLIAAIETDPRLQPVSDRGVWNEKQCQMALERTLALRRTLRIYAGGDVTVRPPVECTGGRTYFRLGPRAGGEPVLSLSQVTVLLPQLGMGADTGAERVEGREPAASVRVRENAPPASVSSGKEAGGQMDLFGETAATAPVRHRGGIRP